MLFPATIAFFLCAKPHLFPSPSDHLPHDPTAFAPPALVICPHINPQEKWFYPYPICHVSSPDCDRAPLYNYRSPLKSGASNTAYRPRSLSPMHLFCPIIVGPVCPRSDSSQSSIPFSTQYPLQNDLCRSFVGSNG